MKKFRIIGMVLVAIFMGVNFTSCNPDDKKEPTENPVEKPRKRLVYLYGPITSEYSIKCP